MVRCVVRSCRNNSAQCRKDISFFKLPSNDIIREGWLQKIGEVKLPNKIEFARICSDHFNEECFGYGKKSKRRNLLQTALPTLFLTSPKVSGTSTNDSSTIQRSDTPTSENDEWCVAGPSNATPGGSNSWNEESAMDNIDEQNTSSRSNPWMDITFRATRTPPTSSEELCHMPDRTFPRRSQRSKVFCGRLGVLRRKNTKEVTKMLHSILRRRKRTTSRDELLEYVNEDNVPMLKRRRLFMDGNEIDLANITPRTEGDDPYETIKSLKAELQHYRELNDFHLKSRCTYVQVEESFYDEVKALKLQMSEKNKEIEQLVAEVKDMKKIIKDLQAKLEATHEDEKKIKEDSENEMRELLRTYFTEGQIRCIIKKRKWIHWSIDDYAAAISLRSISPKAYRYLRLKLNFPLPSLSSLRRWALKTFDIREGFLADVFAVMKEKGKDLSPMEKITVLSFDEMGLSQEPFFDTKLEKLIGPCSKVQVIMCRGLFANWKQPIFYKFDQPMTKDILMECVVHLQEAGYEVVAAVSDLGNKGVWGELKITPDNYFFEHPLIEGAQIFVFADVPHLLKLLRNWFVDEGLSLGNCKNIFTADVFESIIKLGNSGDLRVAHRITERTLHVVGSARQAVRPAARIWSHTAAKAIEWAGNQGLLDIPEYEKFSYFVSTVNKWFDVHNSYAKYGAHPGVNGFGIDLENQMQLLVLMSMYIENMRVGKRKSLMPFQKGIIISNASLKGLFNYLQSKYPEHCKYILTRRLQQDILENFFSYVRAMGSGKDNPSAYDFRYRLRWYILGKHSHAVFTMNKNTEEDESTVCLSSSICSSRTTDSPFAAVTPNDPRATSTPCPGITLHAPESTNVDLDNEFSNELDCTQSDDQVILTEELFRSIIDISPDDLLEDALENEKNDESDIDVCNDTIDDDEELTRFIKRYFESSTPILGCKNASDIVQEAGLEYVAGYVAHCFKNIYSFLGDKTKDIHDNDEQSWVKTVSKGYLTYPSETLLLASKIVEKCFLDFHGNDFSKEEFVIQKVVKMAKNTKHYPSQIPDKVLQCLVRTRTYIRVKEIGKRLFDEKEQRKKDKKMKKFVGATKAT
ncbi:uncharacterized protein [Temnothorax nylanderi]|uniref:uncharacterized protein isoform X2 n=1 Tax=Temnothorax nylanderi TaxID=102681 RepID=UPI003A8C5BA3